MAEGDMNAPLIFDRAGAVDRVDGDLELLDELVEILYTESPMMLSRIQDAVATSNAKELSSAAHSIKSALGNVGAMVAHGLALRLELCGKNEQLHDSHSLLHSFERAVEEFRAAYDEFKRTR